VEDTPVKDGTFALPGKKKRRRKSGGDPESMMSSQTKPSLMKKKAIAKAFRWLNSFFEKQQVLRNARLIRCLNRQLFPSIPTVYSFPTLWLSSPNAERKLSQSSVAIRS
jgi:hypothetical protein